MLRGVNVVKLSNPNPTHRIWAWWYVRPSPSRWSWQGLPSWTITHDASSLHLLVVTVTCSSLRSPTRSLVSQALDRSLSCCSLSLSRLSKSAAGGSPDPTTSASASASKERQLWLGFNSRYDSDITIHTHGMHLGFGRADFILAIIGVSLSTVLSRFGQQQETSLSFFLFLLSNANLKSE